MPRARRCEGSRNGIALLAVLAFILLLTILVVSFISFTKLNHVSTFGYGRSVAADEIAKGGLQDVISDLRAEIIAGSKKDATGTTFTQSGITVYLPATNLTAMPARIGYSAASFATNATSSTFAPSLVRVSRATGNANAVGGDLFFTQLTANTGPYTNNIAAVPGGTILNRASLAPTSASSYNGRDISVARWNKPVLLAPTASTVPSPFTTAPPDWVYVTRTGSRVCITSDVTSHALSSSANIAQTYTAPVAGQNPVASPVLGRYAFVVYDEGALLDANVAGFTSTAAASGVSYSDPTTDNVQTVNGKSYLAYADLTQLPGLTGAQSVVDNFVNWRNASAATALGSPITGPNYLKAVFTNNLTGFIRFQSNTTTGASDSPLLERQDLVNYFANLDAAGGTSYSNALPYLGTFTRAVAAPSYSPPSDASTLGGAAPSGITAIYSYKTNAETSTTGSFTATRNNFNPPSPFSQSPNGTTIPGPNPNRDLPNVRFPSTLAAGTLITHYNDDTTTSQYAVNPGTSLIQTRFSLARINWLSSSSIGGSDPAPNGADPGNPSSAPSTTYKTAILSCFGLQWGVVGVANGGNPCWTYVGSNGGTTAVGNIETLDQVAKENREPNFFELLKASILAGSLGVGSGVTGWVNGTVPPFQFRDAGVYSPTGGIEGLYGYSLDAHVASYVPAVPAPCFIPDIQIMKIGADIIDQYDADSYPTAIYFKYSSITDPYDAASSSGVLDHMLYGEADMVFGDENLPYLDGIYTIAGTATSSDTQGMNGWVQPQVWNPHQMPASFPTQAPLQTNYQIRAYGQADLQWGYEFTPTPTPPTSALTGQTAIPGAGVLDGSYINFSYTTATAYQLLYPTSWPTSSNLSGITCTPVNSNSTIQSSMSAKSTMTDYSTNPFVAFWLGNDLGSAYPYQVYPDADGSGNPQLTKVNTEPTGFTFALGWLDSHNGFHPYSFLTSPLGYTYGIVGTEKNPGASPHANTGSAYPPNTGDDSHTVSDPRTTRVSTLGSYSSFAYASTYYPNSTGKIGFGTYSSASPGWGAPVGSNFIYTVDGSGNRYPADWETNSTSPLASTGANKTYYKDLDGLVRGGDGLYCNPATGDGVPLYTIPGTPTGGPPYAAGDSGGNVSNGRRPVILNRPFRSVAEMGYAYRDMPFKSLDFFTALSADAALLDVFSLTDESKISSNQISTVVAGQFNPSNAPFPVIQAVLAGGAKKDFDPTYNLGAESSALAQQIAMTLNPIAGPSPLLTRADLVTKLSPSLRGIFTTSADQANKAYLEAPIRALSDVTNTRTWNLMIDVIAQSGQMAPAAKTLNDFIVQGERRYWLHVAIDRYTGKIIAQQLEPVYE